VIKNHVPDILCGAIFEDLPVDQQERCFSLREAEETFRIFYEMTVEILMLKEQGERVRKAAEANGAEDLERASRVAGSCRPEKRCSGRDV